MKKRLLFLGLSLREFSRELSNIIFKILLKWKKDVFIFFGIVLDMTN